MLKKQPYSKFPLSWVYYQAIKYSYLKHCERRLARLAAGLPPPAKHLLTNKYLD